jgi:hypothetical protein
MRNNFTFVAAILSFLLISGCAQRGNRSVAGSFDGQTSEISALKSINEKIDHLFSAQLPDESVIKSEFETIINEIQQLPISNITNNENKLFDLVKTCTVFSNLLVHISRKISAEKINASMMASLLRQSAKITDFTKKIRNVAMQYSEPTADTLWLSVSYNDKYLNILSKINAVTFLEDTKHAKKIIEYEIIDMVDILNEALDYNIYQSILSELEYDNTALIRKFNEKLSKEGVYADDKISGNEAMKKFLKHIQKFCAGN